MANKSSLENVLKAVLSVGNAEQNFAYAPYVFDSHYNIVTSFILDYLSANYPAHTDALLPFLANKTVHAKSGLIDLPDDFRNMIGSPTVSATPSGGKCTDEDIQEIDTKREFELATLKGKCKSYPITMVNQAEWDYRTTSTYAYPTYKDPIGMYVGDKKIKVCPFDVGPVVFTYVKKENIYRFGYITQPDDTYIYDKNTSVESQWEAPAFELLFKGVFALYSAYSRDNSIMEWSTILNKAGLF